MLVDSLGIAPTLLYKIDFAVEFGEENDLEAMSFAYDLKIWFDINKVRLVVKDAATTAGGGTFFALEIFALSLQVWSFAEASFLQNNGHSFEHTCSWVSMWKVKALARAICKDSIGHLDLHLQDLTIWTICWFAIETQDICLHPPIFSFLWDEFWHFTGRESICSSFWWVVACKPMLTATFLHSDTYYIRPRRVSS